MPFKSYAQFRKFGELVKEGKISKGQYLEWWSSTDFDKLPEHKKPNAKKKSK